MSAIDRTIDAYRIRSGVFSAAPILQIAAQAASFSRFFRPWTGGGLPRPSGALGGTL
jgi:hypothetical protein